MESFTRDIRPGNVNDDSKLDDYHEAEFQGATLSLTRENDQSSTTSGATNLSPKSSDLSTQDDNANANSAGKLLRGNSNASHRQATLRSLSVEETKDFFAVRNGALESAAEQCKPVLLENLDGSCQGYWLLTEIDHWDAEKERLVFITDYSLLIIKYDFITLKLIDYRRYHLKEFDSITIGELKYPERSLMPRINGAMDFIKGRVLPKMRQSRNPPGNSIDSSNAQPPPPSEDVPPSSSRNQIGVRCMWNQGQPLPFLKKWNPWSRDIPWLTYTSHPLVRQEGAHGKSYDIEDFSRTLVQTLERLDVVNAPPHNALTPLQACEILYQPILIENYAGILSAFHNANDFGFFKSRGKVSF